jgi:hypothetical protein
MLAMAFPSTQLGILAGLRALQLPAVRHLPTGRCPGAPDNRITIPSSPD